MAVNYYALKLTKKMGEWAKFPMDALADERLTLRHYKIIAALIFYDYRKYQPTRAEIAEKTKIPLSHISRATRDLCEFGWILKQGDGGKNMRCDYKLLNPIEKIGTESVPSLSKPATLKGTDSVPLVNQSTAFDKHRLGAPEGTDSVSLKAPSQCGAIIRVKKIQKIQDAQAILAALGVSENIADDFIDLCKQKRAPVTVTGIEGIKREALKAGCTFEDAIRTCCERGWKTFNAAWVINKGEGLKPQQKTKPWFITSTGIDAKGAEIGISHADDEPWQEFKARVYMATGITSEMVKAANKDY